MTEKISIYMDYNASAPLLPAVKAAMVEAMETVGNAASIHAHGRAGRACVDHARREICEYVDAKGAQLVFTGSATEANNMVLRGIPAKSFLISSIEHPSLFQVRDDLHYIPVDGNGVVQLQALERILKNLPAPALVSVMLVNNETGVIQPLAEIVQIARACGAVVHTDAVQALGKLPVSFHKLGVDLMTIASHKMGGPAGVGALIIREGVTLNPLILGGGHEQGLRAGTQNIALIEGFRIALQQTQGAQLQATESLRNQMEEAILNFCPAANVYGRSVARAPNTSYIAMPGVSAEVQLMAFDLAGISVSSGSACSSGKVRPSHVLKAMGIDYAQAGGVIRVSLGWDSKPDDIEAFIANWKQIYESNARKVA